jgi:hypothetical protein
MISEPNPNNRSEPATESRRTSSGMLIVRYGIGGVIVLGAIVLLIVSPGGIGVDGFAIAAGGGLSVLMINFMYRLSVSSELDRNREEQARVYLEEHGEWPEDDPTRPERIWTLAAGVVTYEQELAQQAAAGAGT